MRHRLEQGPGVLLPPVHLLTQMINQILTSILSITINLQETALTCVSSNQNTEDLELLDGDPRVRREALQHGHQELEAARPVHDQQHHAQQVEDLHEHSHGLQQLEYVMEDLLQICDGWLTLAIEF